MKAQTISGIKWVGISQLFQQIGLLLVNLILARLLAPSDFGLASLMMVIAAVVNTMVDMGFTASIIQRKEITSSHLSTAFFISLITGFVLSSTMFFTAPLFSIFFEKPELATLLKVFSVAFVINSFISVQKAINERDLNFKTTTKINLTALLFGILLKVTLAFLGYGVWSIVFGELLIYLLTAFLFWFRSSWRPSYSNCRLKEFKELFSFGHNVLLADLFSNFSSNIDVMVIAKLVSSYSLGLYSIGYSLSGRISSQINSVVQKVMFPGFSRAQDDPILMRRIYLNVTKHISIVAVPAVAGLIFIAPEFIKIILGKKWIEATPIVQILCVYAMSNSLGGVLWGQVLKAKGLSRLVLNLSIIRLFALIFFIFIGSRFGVEGIAFSVAFYGWIFRFVYQSIVNNKIGITMLDYIMSILPSLKNSLVMSCVLLLLKYFLLSMLGNELIIMIITIITGCIVYLGGLWFFNKRDFMDSLNIIRMVINKR